MKRKLTIKQIAEMTGTSTTAVSFALNGKKGVSEATREKILEVVKENRYIPNVNSQRLILQRSFNLILAIDPKRAPLNNFYYTSVVPYIVEKASELGYNVVLLMLSESFGGSRLETTLMQHNADGILFFQDISDELTARIREWGVPFVVIDSQKNPAPYPSVQADYVLSAYCATKHLLESGHRKIAFIGNDGEPDFYETTLAGYKKALGEYGIVPERAWIRSEVCDEASVKACVGELLQRKEIPTAFFCAGDYFSIHLMNNLKEAGYEIPDDFSVTSLDDISLARYYRPALTTVRIDEQAMGTLAVTMLDKLISRETIEEHVFVMSDNLKIRESVKKIDC